MWKGERGKEAQEKSVSAVCLLQVFGLPLSFKCFVAGRESERRIGDEL